MKTYFFITAILLLAVINCSAQVGEHRKHQEKNVAKEAQSVVVDPGLAGKTKPLTTTGTNSSNHTVPISEKSNYIIPDSLKTKITTTKRK